jgi:hypothetical protein
MNGRTAAAAANYPTARFWILGPGSEPVRITLRPGQSLEWCEYSRHEEGWSSSHERWTYSIAQAGQPARIVRESESDGTDCDGRMSTEHEGHATLDQLRTNAALLSSFGLLFPTWTEDDHSQRDYAAERAGY